MRHVQSLPFDEPVAGLDPVATQELYRLVQQVNKDAGITIIMVSHDVRGAMPYASHVLHLQRAQRFFGTAREYGQTELGRRFLGGAGGV